MASLSTLQSGVKYADLDTSPIFHRHKEFIRFQAGSGRQHTSGLEVGARHAGAGVGGDLGSDDISALAGNHGLTMHALPNNLNHNCEGRIAANVFL